MAKNKAIVPRNRGTVPNGSSHTLQELTKLVTGNPAQPGATVAFTPDDPRFGFERMGAGTLVDDPGIIHQPDGHNLVIHVNHRLVSHRRAPLEMNGAAIVKADDWRDKNHRRPN
jgi:hypothetical protein